MVKTQTARALALFAAAALCLIVVACGGGNAGGHFVQTPTYSVTAPPLNPSSFKVGTGGNSTATITISPANGYTGTVNLSCAVTPANANLPTCKFSSTSVAITSSASGNSTLTVSATSATPVSTYTIAVTAVDGNGMGPGTGNPSVLLAIAGPRQAQAILFPILTSTSPVFGSFTKSVLSRLSGIATSLKWNEIESSNAGCTASTGYDFSAYDANLALYIAKGAKINLIVWPATEGGNNDPSTSGSTPCYIFSTQWQNDPSVNAPNPQDMAVCGNYNGDSSNPFYTQATSGSGGSWNISTSSDLSGLPVSYEAPFTVGYKNFIAQVITHYNGNPNIGYIRFGLSQGGENSPECNPYWPNYSRTTYLNYVQAMTQFIAQQNPTMTILADLHAVGSPADLTYADQEAAFAFANNMGFGTNGWQKSDISGYPNCDSDWCNLFNQYGNTVYGTTPITLSLQTLQASDPTNTSQTGSLVDLINQLLALAPPQYGPTNLELYLDDVALAYDYTNYCNYKNAQCTGGTPNYSQTDSTNYKTAIASFLSAP